MLKIPLTKKTTFTNVVLLDTNIIFINPLSNQKVLKGWLHDNLLALECYHIQIQD